MQTEPNTQTALEKKEALRIKLIPFIVGCALFMQMLDSTVVATAIPAMAQSLGTTAVRMNIAITAYLLAMAIFVPICGWAADRFGAKKIFIWAIFLFTLTSLACALSTNLAQLAAFRFVQGFAGAMMVPVGRIILIRTVPKENLLSAMAFLSMPALVGPIIGPPLGGFLVTYVSWHWIFFINIPIGILGIALVVIFVNEYKAKNPPKLDWLGFIFSSIALASLIFGFESLGHASHGFSSSDLILLFSVGIICAFLYHHHSKRVAYPIIDFSLLKIPSFSIATLGGNLSRFAVGASPFLLAMLLQIGFNLSPFAAGMITFANAIGAIAMKTIATRIINRYSFRRVLIINSLISGIFVMLQASFNIDTPIWIMIGILIISGFSRSLQFTAVNTLTYADITDNKTGNASSFAAMAQQVAISLGVGLAALTVNLSMSFNNHQQVQIPDIKSGFIIIGIMSILGMFAFMRLDKTAGNSLRTNRKLKP